MIRLVLVVALIWSLACGAAAADRQRFTMLVDIAGQEIEGMPLAWSQQRVFLLGRDGRLWEFAPAQATRFRKISASFSSFSAAEMQAAMVREFAGRLRDHRHGTLPGRASRGQRELLGQPLRGAVSFVHELLQPPRAARARARVSAGRRGLAAPRGFRALLGQRRQQRTARRAGLLLAGEQSRDPVRPGSRVKRQSRVAAERGHGDPRGHAPDGVQHGRTQSVCHHAAVGGRGVGHDVRGAGRLELARLSGSGRPHQSRTAGPVSPVAQHGRQPGDFVNLLGSDRQFQSNPGAAYAEAWAWVFFFTETYPQQFGQYVQAPRRPAFEDYPLARRIADFTAVFGNDLRMLETHFLRFIDGLRCSGARPFAGNKRRAACGPIGDSVVPLLHLPTCRCRASKFC